MIGGGESRKHALEESKEAVEEPTEGETLRAGKRAT